MLSLLCCLEKRTGLFLKTPSSGPNSKYCDIFGADSRARSYSYHFFCDLIANPVRAGFKFENIH